MYLSAYLKGTIIEHNIEADTRTRSGQWIYVVECPVSQRVELVHRFDNLANANCPCGEPV